MSERFDHLVQLMARLRAQDGCPWDRKQTHDSLKPYLLEETYEVLDTIDRGDMEKLREELGDLFLQILFHAEIGTETGDFTIDEIMQLLSEKLVRRHPHVFGSPGEKGTAVNAEHVLSRWEEIKRGERKQAGHPESVLDGVPKTLPALLRAFQVQARTSRVGFDWPHTDQGVEKVIEKIEEELRELREAMASALANTNRETQQEVEAELGDVLFALVNLSRFLKVNPEDALRKATTRFTDRFHHIEAEAARSGRALADLTLEEMDALWEEAKRAQTPRAGSDTGP